MTNYWTLLWQRMTAQDAKVKAELARLAVLQKTASDRRAEFAAAPNDAARKCMEDAEAAHTAALQAWDNKQSRQKSR